MRQGQQGYHKLLQAIERRFKQVHIKELLHEYKIRLRPSYQLDYLKANLNTDARKCFEYSTTDTSKIKLIDWKLPCGWKQELNDIIGLPTTSDIVDEYLQGDLQFEESDNEQRKKAERILIDLVSENEQSSGTMSDESETWEISPKELLEEIGNKRISLHQSQWDDNDFEANISKPNN
jgi:hypothetical protein